MCTRSSTLREHQQRLLRDNDDATTTTTTTSEQLPPRLVRLVKRALLLVASAKCTDGETESKSIRRLGEFIREKRGKEKEDKEEDKVLSFLETQMTKRRGTPTAKSLLRLTCIQKEEEEEEDEERRTAATTTSHSSTAGKKEEERKRREDLYFMEWQSAFYEQLWMEERKLREEKIVLAKKATTSLMSSSAVLSPDGPLSMMGDEYARTPSTAGKTSASSVDDEEDDGEDNTARSGSKCDYRDWNAITRSPILKNTMNTPQQRAAHSNRSGVDDGNLTLPVTNLLRTLVLKEEEEDKEEDKEDKEEKDKEEELREGGAITPRPIDKNNLDDDENVQFEFRTPDQASKSKKDPQHLTPPGAPLRVRNDFRRVDEMHREAHFGGWKTNERRAASGTVFEDLLKDAEDDEGDQAPRRSLF